MPSQDEETPIPYEPNTLIHPGEYLVEIMDDRGITNNDLSVFANVDPGELNALLAGQCRLSYYMADRLTAYLGEVIGRVLQTHQASYDWQLMKLTEQNQPYQP